MKKNEEPFFSSNPPGVTERLRKKRVFIAGAGGLGSNVATSLVRAGVSDLVIADFDRIEPSNLNRQQYFRDQVGMLKVDALKETLLRINPDLKIKTISKKITCLNCESIISASSEIIFECFDRAEAKAMIAAFCMKERPGIPVIAVSGLAGTGECGIIKVRKGPANLWIVGDLKTEMNPENGTISSRVAYTAALQAHTGIRIMLGLELP
ncbi:MAG: sulfur carrier protein ThiS adenylyltransferase ThiF [Victivallales bacterium]|jgi:sulfur carrier protein ThiS adenylyltransferase